MLLQEILQAASMSVEDDDLTAKKSRASAVAALSEIGVHRMEPTKAAELIQLRIDWPKL